MASPSLRNDDDRGTGKAACQFSSRAKVRATRDYYDMRIHKLLAVLCLTTTAACSILESNSGPAVSVSAVAAPLDLALGDTVRISIAVRNTGDGEVSIGT